MSIEMCEPVSSGQRSLVCPSIELIKILLALESLLIDQKSITGLEAKQRKRKLDLAVGFNGNKAGPTSAEKNTISLNSRLV